MKMMLYLKFVIQIIQINVPIWYVIMMEVNAVYKVNVLIAQMLHGIKMTSIFWIAAIRLIMKKMKIISCISKTMMTKKKRKMNILHLISVIHKMRPNVSN